MRQSKRMNREINILGFAQIMQLSASYTFVISQKTMTHLLHPQTIALQNGVILITPIDEHCCELRIQVISRIEESEQSRFSQIISYRDFHTPSNRLKCAKQSILFLKMAMSKVFHNRTCIELTPKQVGPRSGEIIKVAKTVWDKVIIGPQSVNQALSYMTSEGGSLCDGIALRINYPSQILIVLPKVIDAEAAELAAKHCNRLLIELKEEQRRKDKEQFFGTAPAVE